MDLVLLAYELLYGYLLVGLLITLVTLWASNSNMFPDLWRFNLKLAIEMEGMSRFIILTTVLGPMKLLIGKKKL